VRLPGTVNVLVTNSRELRSLNLRFRGKDKSTDVLSFPAPLLGHASAKPVAGDLAISAEIARENATRLGHSLAAEIKFSCCTEFSIWRASIMSRIMARWLARKVDCGKQLKLAAGLIERTQPPAGQPLHRKVRTDRPAARRRSA